MFATPVIEHHSSGTPKGKMLHPELNVDELRRKAEKLHNARPRFRLGVIRWLLLALIIKPQTPKPHEHLIVDL